MLPSRASGRQKLFRSLGWERLYAGRSDGTLLSWSVSPGNWVGRNCELTGRNFIRQEWCQFFGDEPLRVICEQYPLETPTPGS